MKRLSTYFTIGCIICGYCGLAVAGTSVISNVLTQSNSYLKEAGLVQKKYSGIAREYASMKVGVPDNLAGGKIAAAKAQAEGVQEQANRVQEQVAMAQEAQANAMAKVADLNAKMTSAMATAQSTLSEGIAITEQYKTAITDGIDTVKNAPDIAKGLADRAVNSVKDTAMSTVDSVKGTVDSVKDQATGIAGDVKSATGKSRDSSENETVLQEESPTEEAENAVFGENTAVPEAGTFRQPVSLSQGYEIQAVQPQPVAAVQQIMPAVSPEQPRVSLSNQAAAIQSAAVMADNAVVSDAEMQVMPDLPEMPVAETAVSAADVMAAAASQPVKEVRAEIQRSRLNIEEQLQQTSNRTDTNKMRRLEQKKTIRDKQNEVKTGVEKTTARRRFNKDAPLLNAETKNISDTVLNAKQKVKALNATVKDSHLVREKAIIRESAHE